MQRIVVCLLLLNLIQICSSASLASPTPETAAVRTTNEPEAVLDLSETESVSDATPLPVTPMTMPPARRVNDNCTIGDDPDNMTQDEFTTQLTQSCRYDRLAKPPTDGALNVSMLIDIRHIEAVDQLQFKMHMHVQYKYKDKRLDYTEISPKRGKLIGEVKLRDKIWIPHVIIYNERDSSIMGLEGKDILVSISPKGAVVYSYRMTATVYCWMDLKKFPFDEQECDMHFRSWTYNATYLNLSWDGAEPVQVAKQLHLTEFKWANHSTNKSLVNASLLRDDDFEEKFDDLGFYFKVSREIGFYIMDYFIPSILLVCTSWLTFWLQADNTAPRVTLGTSTMLSFITLASGQSKSLPKVSMIKANEIWFLGCTMFIFASMAEFAFVNIIWRRKKQIELKKVNSKHILKSTLTPKLARRDLQRSLSASNLHKSHSCSSLYGNSNRSTIDSNYLTVNSYHSVAVPTITMHSEDDLIPCDSRRQSDTVTVTMRSTLSDDESVGVWTTMSPQEIAQWIDKRSRLLFPTAFLIFNIFYWSFVYLL